MLTSFAGYRKVLCLSNQHNFMSPRVLQNDLICSLIELCTCITLTVFYLLQKLQEKSFRVTAAAWYFERTNPNYFLHKSWLKVKKKKKNGVQYLNHG